jgi:hypothetical protein
MNVLTGVKTPAQGGETGSSLRYSDIQTGLCENSSSDFENFRNNHANTRTIPSIQNAPYAP